MIFNIRIMLLCTYRVIPSAVDAQTRLSTQKSTFTPPALQNHSHHTHGYRTTKSKKIMVNTGVEPATLAYQAEAISTTL
jgi:hypothetical protein